MSRCDLVVVPETYWWLLYTYFKYSDMGKPTLITDLSSHFFASLLSSLPRNWSLPRSISTTTTVQPAASGPGRAAGWRCDWIVPICHATGAIHWGPGSWSATLSRLACGKTFKQLHKSTQARLHHKPKWTATDCARDSR